MDRLIVIISGLFLPSICYLIEVYIPKPEIIEEVLKFVLIFFLIKNLQFLKNKYEYILTLGISFAFAELIFYFVNFYNIGTLNIISFRFFSTSALHVLTYLTIVLIQTNFKKIWYPVLIFLPITLHYLFNTLLK